MAVTVPSTAAEWIAACDRAIAAVLLGKTYSIGDRQVTRENLKEIRDLRAFWVDEAAESGTSRGIPYNVIEVPAP